MCWASLTTGWEPPTSLSSSCAALPREAPLLLTQPQGKLLLSAYYAPGKPGLSVPFSFVLTLPRASPHLRLPLPHLRLFLCPSLSFGPANRKQPERSRAAGPPEPSICTHRGLSAGVGGELPVYENHKDPQGGALDRPPGSPSSLDLSRSQRGPHTSLQAPSSQLRPRPLPSPTVGRARREED